MKYVELEILFQPNGDKRLFTQFSLNITIQSYSILFNYHGKLKMFCLDLGTWIDL